MEATWLELLRTVLPAIVAAGSALIAMALTNHNQRQVQERQLEQARDIERQRIAVESRTALRNAYGRWFTAYRKLVPQLDSLAELVRVVDRTPEDYEMIAKESGAVMQTMADMTAAFHDAYFLDWDPGRRELFETTAEAIRIAHVEFENVASHHRTHMLHLKRNGRQLDELDDSIVRGRAGIEELRGRLKASATGKAKKKAPETQRLEQELEASEQRVRDKESAVAAHRTELREWDRACQLCRGDDLQKVLKLAKCERAIETMFRSLGGLSWIPTEVMTVRRTPVQAGLPH